ncbi:hypothetical protein [Oceanirhabdus sp. W0125-5]|uniref:hypothetical protein n=1 Tax=Oceanirhabdus sp. W0125-5 TaxID=2999116 RepID=UPI0022F33F48|nr:hypothetical protein [Oceanirhabdus sp. W0125-5]WBW96573.1 hypothetical protein OW730_23210 [Oceanirhabdus sp. W0125-5]
MSRGCICGGNSGDGFKDKCFEFLCEDDGVFGFFYRFEEDSTFPLPANNTPIPFNQQGPFRGIFHDKVNTPEEIKLLKTGIYEVTFYADSGGPDYFGIELAGTLLPESIYRSRSAAGIKYGQVIIRVDTPNTLLRFLFVFRAPSTLAAKNNAVGAPVAVNVSLKVIKLGEVPV